MTVDDLQNT